MGIPIYYTKFEFEWHTAGMVYARLVCNVTYRELSYQQWDQSGREIVFSFGHKLTDEDIKEMLPYINANSFEPYRNRKMSMDDPGYDGYRDEITMRFRGITDSEIPLIELPMDYFYTEKYEWPTEKLYRYLANTFFPDSKKKFRHKSVNYWSKR